MSNPHDLDVSDALVVIECVDADGQKQYLPSSRTDLPATPRNRGQVSFDLAFDASSNSSFCRVHIPFVSTLRPREISPLSLHIPPERVTALDTERPGDALPEDVRRQLGDKEVVRLQFNLKSPADLVVPHDHLIPKSKAFKDSLGVVVSLARMTTITFYAACLPEEQLRPLCDAISYGNVRSIAKYTDISKVYRGRGGLICTDVNTLLKQACPPNGKIMEKRPSPANHSSTFSDASCKPASEPGQAGPSRTRQQGPSSDPLPPYPTLHSASKRQRPSPTADVEEDHIGVLRRLVVEMYGGLGKEVQEIKEDLRETKQGLHATRQELYGTKEELHTIKQELHEAKQELGQVKAKVEMDLEQYIDEEVSICGMIDQAIDELDVYTKDEVDERLHEAQERWKASMDIEREAIVDQAMDALDVYTRDEVDERLIEVQEHCEGLNNIETEDIVLGAKSDLEKDVRNEIKEAKQDLQKGLEDRVRSKVRGLAMMLVDELFGAEGRVMKCRRMGIRRMMQGRRCRHGGGSRGAAAAVLGRKFRRQLRTALVKVQALRPPPGPLVKGDTPSSTASFVSTG